MHGSLSWHTCVHSYIAEACRIRVILKFPKKFSSPEAAEKHFYEKQNTVEEDVSIPNAPLDITPLTTNKLIEMVMLLPEKDQLNTISEIFCYFAEAKHGVYIRSDFLQFVVNASEHLLQCGRSNVVYGVAKAIGRRRSDGSDSRFPAKRMPMGLLEHMVNFYNSDSYSKVNFPANVAVQ